MSKKVNDSVIDPPKPGLCPDIWEKVVDATGTLEIWQLKPEVKKQLVEATEQICALAKLSLGGIVQDIHITGSITSNLYTENADIDMHFVEADNVKIKESAEQTTSRLRSAFEQLSTKGIIQKTIGSHPIELYFQKNKFQDLMSIGCYSLFTDAWLVGPEIKDASYNPYDDMYHEIKHVSEQLLADIRQTVLTAYEKAIVLMKASKFNDAKSTIDEAYNEMAAALQNAVKLYQNARMMRKRLSDPTSHEEAIKMRDSKKWKIVDATFKLLDKFGYLAILKGMQQIFNLTLDKSTAIEAADSIINLVKSNLGDEVKLADSEKRTEMHESSKEIAVKMRLVIEKLVRKYMKHMHKSAFLSESSKEDPNEKYVREFKDYFGYQDDYMPTATYEEKMDSIARECALRMPNDTAARETEGDAVMMLVLSCDDEAAKVGKKLGDCMMKKGKHDEETLLKRMSDAYKALQNLWSKFERAKQMQQESVNKLFKKQTHLIEHWEPKYDDMPYNQWGERWMKLPHNHYVVRHIDDVAKDCQLDPTDYGPKIDNLNVSSVHVYSDCSLLVTVFGGANGGQMSGENNFKMYLAVVKKFISKLLDGHCSNQMFDDAWLVDWDNDCCDDVWTLRFCLKLAKDQLQKFKDCTELPLPEDYTEVIKRQKRMQESSFKPTALAAVISMLAVPGILPKTALAAQLDNVKNIQTSTVNSPAVKTAIAKATNGSYDGLNLTNIVNAVARTIYEEAKGEGKAGQDAVASVIWNRAGGKAKNLIPSISANLQFSCWNEYKGGWKDSSYRFAIPSEVFKNKTNMDIWKYCMELAVKLANEEFTSTIGDMNSYLNKEKADKEAVETWGKLCTKKLGNHWFGYQACYDGFKKEKNKQTIDLGKTYVVQKGDSLEKIAKKFNTNVSSIMKLNSLKDKNTIRIGQRLKL